MKKAIFLVVILVATCFAKDKPLVQVHISATADIVKAQIIKKLSSEGFMVVSDSTYLLSMSKRENGFGARLAYGNAYSNAPEHRVNFTIAADGDGVVVTGDQMIVTAFANGSVRQSPLDNRKHSQALSDLLDNVKKIAETQAAMSKPIASQ